MVILKNGQRPQARWGLASLAGAYLFVGAGAIADPMFVGPLAYLSASDSPFVGQGFEYFHLEDFEDGVLDTPGITVSQAWSVFATGGFRDSVDADDGVVDGSGSDGFSFLSNFQSDPLVLEFTAAMLGGNLPTHVGIAWTDVGQNGGGAGPGAQPVLFSALGPAGESLGEIGPFLLGDDEITGQTAEDRFFGVVFTGGVSAVQI